MIQYYYFYKGNYYVEHGGGKFKCPVTGKWHWCVGYAQLDKDKFKSGKGVYQSVGLPVFYREAEDFKAKFVRVDYIEAKI